MSVPPLLLLCLLVPALATFNYYCASNCYDYLGTCFQQAYSDTACIVCARSLYKQDPDPVTNTCILNNQTQVNPHLRRFWLSNYSHRSLWPDS